MAFKRIVSTSFWDDEKVLDMFSPEDKYFMLYLLTNPHTTQLGIYYLPIKKASLELGYTDETIRVLLDRFESKYNIIKYSQETGEVAIKNYLRHSIIKGGKPVMVCLLKEEKAVKDKSLLLFIYHALITCKDDLNTTVLEYLEHIYILYLSNMSNNNIYNINNDNENDESPSCDFLRFSIKNDKKNLLDTKKDTKDTKKDTINVDVYENNFELLWKLYPRKLGKGSVSLKQKKRLYELGYEQIKRCIERFKKDSANTEEKFIPYGSTFFNSGYVDYLDVNYQVDDVVPAKKVVKDY